MSGTLRHAVAGAADPAPRPSRQSVSVLPCVTSASTCPGAGAGPVAAGPIASAAVPAGRAGSCCQVPPGPLIVSARPSVRISHAAPPAPNPEDRTWAPPRASGGARVQCAPPSPVHAASRLAADPVPAASSAVVLAPLVASRRVVTARPAADRGSAGPAACHVPAARAKMPAVPGRAQVPPASGVPEGLNATAVSALRSHARPAGDPAPARPLVPRDHPRLPVAL